MNLALSERTVSFIAESAGVVFMLYVCTQTYDTADGFDGCHQAALVQRHPTGGAP